MLVLAAVAGLSWTQALGRHGTLCNDRPTALMRCPTLLCLCLRVVWNFIILWTVRMPSRCPKPLLKWGRLLLASCRRSVWHLGFVLIRVLTLRVMRG